MLEPILANFLEHFVLPTIESLTDHPFVDLRPRCIYLGVRGCAGSPTSTRDKTISYYITGMQILPYKLVM